MSQTEHSTLFPISDVFFSRSEKNKSDSRPSKMPFSWSQNEFFSRFPTLNFAPFPIPDPPKWHFPDSRHRPCPPVYSIQVQTSTLRLCITNDFFMIPGLIRHSHTSLFHLNPEPKLKGILSGQRWWSHLPVPNFDGNLSTFITWRLSFFRTIYQIAHQLCYRWKTRLDHGIR